MRNLVGGYDMVELTFYLGCRILAMRVQDIAPGSFVHSESVEKRILTWLHKGFSSDYT